MESSPKAIYWDASACESFIHKCQKMRLEMVECVTCGACLDMTRLSYGLPVIGQIPKCSDILVCKLHLVYNSIRQLQYHLNAIYCTNRISHFGSEIGLL